MDPLTRARRLLWLDSLGALGAGALVLTLAAPIAALDGLPHGVVLTSGLANVGYGAYSGSLAAVATQRGTAPRAGVLLLVAANLAWTLVCVVVLARHGSASTMLGWLHIGGEGLYVGALALLEARWVLPHAR